MKVEPEWVGPRISQMTQIEDNGVGLKRWAAASTHVLRFKEKGRAGGFPSAAWHQCGCLCVGSGFEEDQGVKGDSTLVGMISEGALID